MTALIICMLFQARDSYQPTGAEISSYVNACLKYRQPRIVELRKEQRALTAKKGDAAQSQLQKVSDELTYLNDKKNLPRSPLQHNPQVGNIGTLPTDWKISEISRGELVVEYQVEKPRSQSDGSVQSVEGFINGTQAALLAAPDLVTKHARVKGVVTKGMIVGRNLNVEGLFYVAGEADDFQNGGKSPLLFRLTDSAPLEAAWRTRNHIAN